MSRESDGAEHLGKAAAPPSAEHQVLAKTRTPILGPAGGFFIANVFVDEIDTSNCRAQGTFVRVLT